MRKLLWVALACALFALPSHAQTTPAADASVGYSFLRLTGSNGVNLNGVSGSVSYNANDWFGLVGDLGVYHGSPSGVGFTATTYTFGPRFTYRRDSEVQPFVQALFGGSHLSASYGGFGATSNPFAYSIGGGADLPLGGNDRVGLRPEFDYFGFRSNGSTSNSVRLSVALVFHIGQR
jgi:Outer membrane protein beta-barrel domain